MLQSTLPRMTWMAWGFQAVERNRSSSIGYRTRTGPNEEDIAGNENGVTWGASGIDSMVL